MATSTQAVNSFLSIQEERGREVVDQAKQFASQVTKGLSENVGRAALIGVGLTKTGILSAAAGISLGTGVLYGAYKIARHPIQTAHAIGMVFSDLKQRISDRCKQALVNVEAKLIDASSKQIAVRLSSIRGITPSQQSAIAKAIASSLKHKAEVLKKTIDESKLTTLPIKSITHSFSILLASRAHKRLLGALESIKSFADRYHSLYPDQCRGFTDDLINRMKDGKMSVIESLSLRVKMGTSALRNKLVLFALKAVPDPFENVASPKNPNP